MLGVAMLLLVCVASATAEESVLKDSHGRPVLDHFSEEGFVDCVFRIVSSEETQAHYKLRLEASFKGESVGLEVDLVKGIKSGLDADVNLVQERVYRGGVVFRSMGGESDRLLQALATLYGIEPFDGRMRVSEPFTAIALHQGEIDMRSQPIKIKIFGRDADDPVNENLYNESFFNLDMSGGYVYWNEKDQDYRRPLVQALSQ
jgi:hypothetical protein